MISYFFFINLYMFFFFNFSIRCSNVSSKSLFNMRLSISSFLTKSNLLVLTCHSDFLLLILLNSGMVKCLSRLRILSSVFKISVSFVSAFVTNLLVSIALTFAANDQTQSL